jgi:hypothetical protein
MTSVRTQINCPQCKQPIPAEVRQLFDMAQDPSAKQRILSGQFNIANCPHCGFHGNLATQIVYHDPEKELLLSFSPPGVAISRDEQEAQIGRLINRVVDNLKPEQRKGYIFSPQAVLTMQGLVERILQEDGVTKEMLDKQKERMSLLQRLAGISDEEALQIVAEEEDKNIDEDFFRLISQLAEMSMAQGDENGAQALAQLQQRLLPITTAGKELQKQSQEVQAALKTLQDAGEGLTREKLLELVLEAPTETRLNAYVSLARQGMDYEFFQALTARIEAAEGAEQKRLEGIREALLEATAEVDSLMQQRLQVAQQNVESLLGVDQEQLQAALMQNIAAVDDFFLQALEQRYQTAKKANELAVVEKIETVIQVIQELGQAAQGGVDPEFVQSLIDASDDERKKLFADNADKVDDKLVEALTGLLMQFDQSEDEELKAMGDKVRAVYRDAVRHSMAANMKKG